MEYKDSKDFRQVPTLGVEVESPEDSYVPEGFESIEDFLQDMREEYQLDVDADRENRDHAIEDKKFCAGDHWDPKVLELRQGLPCLTINTIPQFTAQLVGDWRESRKGIKVVPTEDGDIEVAEVRGNLIRSIELKSRADRAYNTAFESSVQCGDGDFRIAVEYSKDDVFDQEIFIRPIEDCLSVVWDRNSIDPTGRDARHVFVDDLMPKKEFKRKWPEATSCDLSQDTQRALMGTGWIEEDNIRVTEYWRMIERDKLIALFQDGSVRVIEENLGELIMKHGNVVRSRTSPCLYAQMHLVTGHEILSGPYEYKLNRVPVIRVSGRTVNIAGKRVRYGLVRFMKDPARLRNFWRSVAAEQLGYAPKAQWIAPESAVEGREDIFRKAHMSRDPLMIYNDDASAPPERLEPPAPQMALLNEAQVNTQDMKDVTGIHDASLGIRSNEVSGKAISARQREGDIASLTFYDNANAAVLEAGDVVNQLISQIYDGTRIIRIVGEDDKMDFLKVNDPLDPYSFDLSVGSYDVVPTTGISYSTRRMEAAQTMMDAIQVWPQLIEVAGDLVAKAQDWPGADDLAKRLKKTIPQELLDDKEKQDQQQQPDPAMQQAQMAMQQMAQELEQLKMDKTIEQEELKIKWFEAETKRLAVEEKIEAENEKLKLEGGKLGIETLKTAMMPEKEPNANASANTKKSSSNGTK